MNATVRGHQGFLVMMRFLRLHGPFCRDCGTATVRRMTANSLWQGWWGIASMAINPFTMLLNLLAWLEIRRLPAPVPGAPGTPMPTGRPLYRRPQILGLLLPLAVAGLLVYGALQDTGTGPEHASVGDCVRNHGTLSSPDLSVVDCGGPDAEFRVVGRFPTTTAGVCDLLPASQLDYRARQISTAYTLCLARLTP
ncbi:hypothetical protein AB0O31_16215 [Kitasatospora cineracea]|uniref:LppU/SCO3897 family protein n=1 Tax=Kitasatospora cineracea TaxID=88074 RepID=UPI003425580D